MKVKLDKNGYIEEYVLLGENSVCTIEVEEPENFDICHFNAYRVVDGVCVFDEEKFNEQNLKVQKNEIRARREKECFSYINRGTLWYNKLTPDQDAELQTWYDAWLDAPETLVIPEKLEWLDNLTNK